MFNLELLDRALIERFALSSTVLKRETSNWLVDMAMWAKNDLKRRVPVKSGTLKNSLRYEITPSEDGGEASFHAVAYGQWLDEGTRPFTIQASKGKPMAFNRGSERVFAMSVRNPGIKARNFTLDTLDAALPEADRQSDDIASRIVRTVM